MTSPTPSSPKVLQRIDRFVGRTTNWLYDHLRHVPRHRPLVLCDALANRDEFPLLEARRRDSEEFTHRVWRRLLGDRPHPADALWLRKARPEALHSHFGYVAAGDFALRAFLDVPWLVGFYGADVYELGRTSDWQEEYGRLFDRLQLALALGPQMAARLEELGCPKSKIAVHALGVDVDNIPNRPRVLEKGSPLRILFAGTFREKKGVEYLIQGAAEARRSGVPLQLTLVGDAAGKPGDAETKATIFREIDRLAMHDAVTHLPFVPFDELMHLALKSHVFAAPSVTSANGDAEGTPFVLQQMMASAMPVIATVHSDIPFLFGEHSGQLIPERDAHAVAVRLQEYTDAPEMLVSHGRMLRARARAALNVRVQAGALSTIYEGVCGARSSLEVEHPGVEIGSSRTRKSAHVFAAGPATPELGGNR